MLTPSRYRPGVVVPGFGWIETLKQVRLAHLTGRLTAQRARQAQRLVLAGACLLAGAMTAQAQLYVNTLVDSTDTVTNCSTGSGPCSLRDAITQANADGAASGGLTTDTINFLNYSVANTIGTITLTSALPTINYAMTINGPGAQLLTVSGNGLYTVFTVSSSVQEPGVSIDGLTIAYGNTSGDGGAIKQQAAAPLYLTNCTILGSAARLGGGIYAVGGGELVVDESTIATNSATVAGGGIYSNSSEQVYVVESTLSGNTADDEGGAIYFGDFLPDTNQLTLVNDTITTNSAASTGGGIDFPVAGLLTAYNSIVAGNTTGGTANSDDCDNCGTQSGNYDMLGGTPPTLGPLQWNGGTTQTIMPLTGSTAICEGNGLDAKNSPGAASLSNDQRGFTFYANQNAGTCNGSRIDAGAVQTNYLTVTNLHGGASGSPDCNELGTGTACSLWDAVSAATSDNSGDIVFASNLFPSSTPGTITLSLPLDSVGINQGLNVQGPGQAVLTISGGNNSTIAPIFNFQGNSIGNISGVTITGGDLTASPGGSGAGGAAIYNLGVLSLVSSTVTGNTADATPVSFGAGISNDSTGSMLIWDSTISGNQQTNANGAGGGIDNENLLTILDSTISGNTTGSGLGGGGIFLDRSTSTVITNSTVSGNSASNGGGIENEAQLVMADSTVAGNTATNDGTGDADGGGGIDNAISGGGGGETAIGLTVMNSIVAGNTNDNGTVDCYNCATNAVNYTTVDGASLTSGNPELGALAVNGLDTQLATMLPLPGSPAIGAGATSELYYGLTTDERGYPRTTGGSLDVGAAQTNYTGITFYTQPTNTVVNSGISPAPQVEVLETDGNLSAPNNTDAVSGVPITLTYSDSPNMTGIPVSATDTVPTIVNSNTIPLATFSGLTPTAVANGVYLTATAALLTQNSNTFDVTGITTSTTAQSMTATYSPSNQTVVLGATVSSAGGTPEGTVTFTVVNNLSQTVGTALSGTLSGGVASANFTLPGGTKAGTYTIEATYNGNSTFAVSSDDSQTLTVNKAPQSIHSFTTLPSPVLYGVAPMTLTATATSGLTVTFRVVSGPGQISGDALMLTGVGTVVLGADQTGNVDYLPATEVTQTIQVNSPIVLDFTISVSGASIETVVPGAAATYTLVVSPTHTTYPGTVTFAVTGLPQGYTATFSPSSIPANGGTQTVTMTVQTTAVTARNDAGRGRNPLGRLSIALGLLLLPLASAKRLCGQSKRLGQMLCLALAGAMAAAMGLSGCGTNANGFFLTAPTSYTLPVTATSGALQHGVSVTLNVE